MAPRIEQLTPGPSALDMLRDVSIVAKDTPVFLRKVHSRFGDIAQFPVPIPAFSINDVDRTRGRALRQYY